MQKPTHKTIKFTSNYSPRKAGEIADLEIRLADFYIGAGVAIEYTNCEKCTDDSPCEECGGEKKTAETVVMTTGNSFVSEQDNEPVQEVKFTNKQIVILLPTPLNTSMAPDSEFEENGKTARELIKNGLATFVRIKQ